MDNNYENIVPWNGANDTGRDVRLKLQRNFAKIGVNFQELDGKFTTVDDLFDLIAQELDKKLSKVDSDTAAELITFLKGIVSKELIEANNGLVVRSSKTLAELQSHISDSLLELDDDSINELGEVDSLSNTLLELPINEGGMTMTLGSLENVSGAADDIAQKDILLVKRKGGALWETIEAEKMRGKDGVLAYPTMKMDVHTGHLILSVPTNNYENRFKVLNGHLMLIQNG